MYGGENSGMPLGPDPVNSGTGTFGADNDYDQPAAIVSGGEDGGAVAFDSNNKNSSAKYFGRRSREKATKSSAPQLDAGYVAASNIANNPNNPEFFRQAAMENAPAPIAKTSGGGHKGLIIGGIVAIVAIVAVVAVVALLPKSQEEHYEVSMEELKKSFNSYASYLINGEASEADIDIAKFAEGYSPFYPDNVYAERVIAGTEKSQDRGQYISNLKKYYDTFATKYEKSKLQNQPGDALDDYFYKYASMPGYGHNDVLRAYQADTSLSANDISEKRFNIETTNKELQKYKNAQEAITVYYYQIAKIAVSHNCVSDSEINEPCVSKYKNDIGEVMVNEAGKNMQTIFESTLELREDAMEELSAVYTAVYEIENKGVQVK